MSAYAAPRAVPEPRGRRHSGTLAGALRRAYSGLSEWILPDGALRLGWVAYFMGGEARQCPWCGATGPADMSLCDESCL